MSADDEPTPAPAESMAADSQSHKRKASEEVQEPGTASPKRPRLDDEKESKVEPAVTKEDPKPEAEASPKQEDTSVNQDKPTPEEPKAHSLAAPREPEPKPARSPIASRKPSIAAPESRRTSGPGPDRGRNRINDEEKKRGQRLFGGLLGTLSRKTDTSQQKKRQDIERRQQERAQAQRIEDDKRRAEKLAKLDHVRNIEQVKFDEQVMRTRHSNILALSQSFSTKSEPKIHYVPWKLTESQEAVRKEQIRNAEELVAREKAEFNHQKVQRLKELGVTVSEPDPHEDTNTGVPPPDRPSSKAGDAQSPPKGGHERPSSKAGVERPTSKAGHEKDHDDAGYVMVEAEEDTVIY